MWSQPTEVTALWHCLNTTLRPLPHRRLDVQLVPVPARAVHGSGTNKTGNAQLWASSGLQADPTAGSNHASLFFM